MSSPPVVLLLGVRIPVAVLGLKARLGAWLSPVSVSGVNTVEPGACGLPLPSDSHRSTLALMGWDLLFC